jgi:hypothetical protein
MEKSYLDIMLGYYDDGKYLDTHLDLMCQQAEMDRISLTTLLLSKKIEFTCHIKYFKVKPKDEEPYWVRSKPQDYIILSKTGKP